MITSRMKNSQTVMRAALRVAWIFELISGSMAFLYLMCRAWNYPKTQYKSFPKQSLPLWGPGLEIYNGFAFPNMLSGCPLTFHCKYVQKLTSPSQVVINKNY